MSDAKPRWTREEMTENLNIALRAAAFEAYKKARDTGTPFVVWQDGKVVEIDPQTIPFEEYDRPSQRDIPPQE